MTYPESVLPFRISDTVKTTYALDSALRGQVLQVVEVIQQSLYKLSDDRLYSGSELTIYRVKDTR